MESRHHLWDNISSPKKELIRSFLNHLNFEIVKRIRPSSVFNFQSASLGNLFLTGYVYKVTQTPTDTPAHVFSPAPSKAQFTSSPASAPSQPTFPSSPPSIQPSHTTSAPNSPTRHVSPARMRYPTQANQAASSPHQPQTVPFTKSNTQTESRMQTPPAAYQPCASNILPLQKPKPTISLRASVASSTLTRTDTRFGRVQMQKFSMPSLLRRLSFIVLAASLLVWCRVWSCEE